MCSFPDIFSAFWHTGPVGLAQHEDFWDTIAQNVKIYRSGVDFMKLNAIVLKDGAEIATDALLCGTGWKSNYPFFDSDLVRSLGLPHPVETESDSMLHNAFAISDVVTDFVVVSLPVPMVCTHFPTFEHSLTFHSDMGPPSYSQK